MSHPNGRTTRNYRKCPPTFVFWRMVDEGRPLPGLPIAAAATSWTLEFLSSTVAECRPSVASRSQVVVFGPQRCDCAAILQAVMHANAPCSRSAIPGGTLLLGSDLISASLRVRIHKPCPSTSSNTSLGDCVGWMHGARGVHVDVADGDSGRMTFPFIFREQIFRGESRLSPFRLVDGP